ncbi:DUF6894 family protein [Sphingomonas bacterium]|uniref:DUF6894 family protein n=1 Tax=Sphingomonas bacterium TaxID=1895847 RepID=UPI001C2DD040|nr:hypothetical protein [Sphingomonas bacterium]
MIPEPAAGFDATVFPESAVATYNINIRTESHIADTLRVDKDDLTELRIELARFVGELLKDHADLIWEDQNWQIDVTDDAGLILYVVKICAVETP